MNATAEFNVQATIQTVVPNVFQTMLGFSATSLANDTVPFTGDRVSGTIGIAGENVTGAIYIHLPEALAKEIVNTMLGNAIDQPVNDGDLNDIVGELANMVGGGFKSALCNADRPCAMSTPAIIRGMCTIEVPQELCAQIFHFSCQGRNLSVEVHVKFS